MTALIWMMVPRCCHIVLVIDGSSSARAWTGTMEARRRACLACLAWRLLSFLSRPRLRLPALGFSGYLGVDGWMVGWFSGRWVVVVCYV